MPSTPLTHLPTLEAAARWTSEQLGDLVQTHLDSGRRFKAMDKTPIKAGNAGPCKMKSGSLRAMGAGTP